MRYKLDAHATFEISGDTTLTGLSNRVHNLTIYAKDEAGNGGASETTYFSVEVPEPFPTTLVVAASGASLAVVGAGLIVYFRKRNH